MYNDDAVDRILDVCDITDVIGEAVQLRPRGSNHIGLCPFHSEKTPSFTVSSSKGIYTCFGCGKKGNVFTFMKDYYGMEFGEALRELAQRYGIVIQQYKKTARQKEKLSRKEIAGKALEFASDYYVRLLDTAAGKNALSYIGKRNFSKETVKEFRLGYSPAGWDELLTEMSKKGYPEQSLIDSGLIIEKEKEKGKYYDRFRDRIMFPIQDSLGKIIGFGARQLSEDKNQPKYINSPQTMLYDKSRVLYGLFQGKNEIRKREYVILTEGYADVISLHQAGYKNAVASSGTSLTTDQLRLLNKFTKKIYIVYDADSAGITAAVRAIDMAFAEGFDVLLISLPTGEDPDSIVRKRGNHIFQEYINDAESFVDFRIRHLKNENKLQSPADLSNAIREIVKTIVKIPDRLQHDEYISRLASILKLSSRQVERIYQEKIKIERDTKHSASLNNTAVSETIAITENNPSNNPQDFTPDYTQLHVEEKLILKYLVSSKEVAEFLMDNYAIVPENMMSSEGKRLLTLIIDLYGKNPDIIKHLVTNDEVHQMDKDFLITLAIDDSEISKEWKSYSKGSSAYSRDLHRPVRDALTRIELMKTHNELSILQEQIKQASETDSFAFLNKYNELSKKEQTIKNILSNETPH